MSRANELERLLFGTIKEVVEDIEDGAVEQYVGLLIELPSTPYKRQVEEVVVWFYRDDEGNGPGSFHIQEISRDE